MNNVIALILCQALCKNLKSLAHLIIVTSFGGRSLTIPILKMKKKKTQSKAGHHWFSKVAYLMKAELGFGPRQSASRIKLMQFLFSVLFIVCLICSYRSKEVFSILSPCCQAQPVVFCPVRLLRHPSRARGVLLRPPTALCS